MTRVLVNSQPRDPEPGLKTLGDLLAWADRTSASDGAVVTAVRLDGVEEPSFRDDAFAARPLDGIAVVEMEVATPASLVAASLDEAIRGLTGLRRHTVEIAQRFRRADAVHANEGLAELTGGLRTLVSLLDALGTAMGVPLERTACNGQTAGEVL
ncbi:MAG TPA: hypothetical protein VIL25_08420, partial [Vicinamibacterales bacterium]